MNYAIAIDEMQAYSYQYDIRVGLPTFAERENSRPTAKLCIQLFHSILTWPTTFLFVKLQVDRTP